MTADEARRLPDQSDWPRVNALSDDEIARAAADDPDAPLLNDEMLAALRSGMPELKEVVSLRLEPRVVEFFRSLGPRHTSMMSRVLTAYADHHTPPAKKRRAGG